MGILEKLTDEDLNDKTRLVVRTVGMGKFVSLIETFGGSDIYIPQRKELLKNRNYAMLISEYDGTNIRELTMKYDVSQSTVYNLIRNRAGKGKEVPGQLTEGELQENPRLIAAAIGVDALLKLVGVLAGNHVYIPKKKSATRNVVREMILEEYDGTNVSALAHKYGRCQATVYDIIRPKLVKGKKRGTGQVPGQMSLEEFGI